MKQKQDIAELSAVGDFMVAADGAVPSVKIVAGREYVDCVRVNERLSDPRLNTLVSRYQPYIEEIPGPQVVERVDELLSHYTKLAKSKFGSGVSLDTMDYAWGSAEKLAAAREELQGLKLS